MAARFARAQGHSVCVPKRRRMIDLRALVAAAAIALAAACSSPSPEQVANDNEMSALAPMRSEYDNTVTGFVINGNQLDVSIDLNAYSMIDRDDVPLLQAEALRRWRAAWIAQHPHQHGELTVRFVDYHGRPFLIKKVTV
jgi:hypothetical protein